MIGALIGGCIGGAFGSYLFNKHSANKTVYVNRNNNNLIEYHRYLESKRNSERLHDLKEIYRIYEYKRTHCPKCGKKIEFDKSLVHAIDSFDDVLKIKVSCGCQSFLDEINIPPAEVLFMIDKDETYKKIENIVKSLYEKITGKVEYEVVKNDYTEKQLKEKDYIERHYGNII